MNYLKPFLVLIKASVSLAVTFTAITCYVVYAGHADIRMLQLAIGVFFLSGGSGALNQYQERKFDARMSRTSLRPIPAGIFSPLTALLIALFFIAEGSWLLYSAFGATPVLLGLFNVVWYNGLYTNLKRITPFAVVPGSLVGAVPAFIGWTAAGGAMLDMTVIFIAFFLFVWQVPHFWLLMLKYGKQYEEAGFPTINQVVCTQSLNRIIISWLAATSLASMLIPVFMIDGSLPFFSAVFLLNIVFIAVFVKLSLGKENGLRFRVSFIGINVFMFLFMIMLIIHRVLPC